MASDTHRPPGIGDHINQWMEFEQEARDRICALRRDARRRGGPPPAPPYNEAQKAMADYMRAHIGLSGVIPRLDVPVESCVSSGVIMRFEPPYGMQTGATAHQAHVDRVHEQIDAYAKQIVKNIKIRRFYMRSRELHFNKLDVLRLAIRHRWKIEFVMVERLGTDMLLGVTMPENIAEDFLGSLPPLVSIGEAESNLLASTDLDTRGLLGVFS